MPQVKQQMSSAIEGFERYDRLLSRVVNTPLLVTRETAETVLGFMADHVGFSLEWDGIPDSFSGVPVKKQRKVTPAKLVDGNMVIPIRGELVSKVSGLKPSSGMVGYNQISEMLSDALMDPMVERIVFDIDTPGGEAQGLFPLVDQIYNARGQKPIISLVNETAASAGYAIASAADRIVISETGLAGSVGVIAMHVDKSEMLKKNGLTVTVVHAGKHKADLTSVKPLNRDGLDTLQDRVDKLHTSFVDRVARNLGIDEKAVRDTEARVYTGQDAVNIGFAHELADVSEGAGAFARPYEITTTQTKTKTKTEKETTNRKVNAMPWNTLNERLGLETKETDKGNEDQVYSLVTDLQEKAAVQDRVNDFLSIHDAESLDEVTAKLQSLVPASEVEDLKSRLKMQEAERAVALLMDPNTKDGGKITAASKDWAIDFYMRDPEGFQKVTANMPRVLPENGVGSEASQANPNAETDQPVLSAEEKADLEAEYGKDAVAKVLKDMK